MAYSRRGSPFIFFQAYLVVTEQVVSAREVELGRVVINEFMRKHYCGT